jgi:hypothetical protein
MFVHYFVIIQYCYKLPIYIRHGYAQLQCIYGLELQFATRVQGTSKTELMLVINESVSF